MALTMGWTSCSRQCPSSQRLKRPRSMTSCPRFLCTILRSASCWRRYFAIPGSIWTRATLCHRDIELQGTVALVAGLDTTQRNGLQILYFVGWQWGGGGRNHCLNAPRVFTSGSCPGKNGRHTWLQFTRSYYPTSNLIDLLASFRNGSATEWRRVPLGRRQAQRSPRP